MSNVYRLHETYRFSVREQNVLKLKWNIAEAKTKIIKDSSRSTSRMKNDEKFVAMETS